MLVLGYPVSDAGYRTRKKTISKNRHVRFFVFLVCAGEFGMLLSRKQEPLILQDQKLPYINTYT
jgi:hypothetical protein